MKIIYFVAISLFYRGFTYAQIDDRNQFRISNAGVDGDPRVDAMQSVTAYNSSNNTFLVVWSADSTNGTRNDEFEIFGQRIAADGSEIGNDFRISTMGPEGDKRFDALEPAIAYNSANNSFLVAWTGDDTSAVSIENEFEIYGQRINANGSLSGSNFRITAIGPDRDTNLRAEVPRLAYNSTDDNFLLTYTSGPNISGLAAVGEFRVFGQRLSTIGNNIGSPFLISDLPPDFNLDFGAGLSDIAYNSSANNYLVIWTADNSTEINGPIDFEIFGQLISASGTDIGNNFQISDMGGLGGFSSVAYNSEDNNYLVAWSGDDNPGSSVDTNEAEIYGQLISANGSEFGQDDFQISTMGPDGNQNFDAQEPEVDYSVITNEYLVVWSGRDSTEDGLTDQEFEIFGQRIEGDGGLVGRNDFRISEMGVLGESGFRAIKPEIAYNSTENNFLVIWEGDDALSDLANNEFEIYGSIQDFCPTELADMAIGNPIPTNLFQAEQTITSSGTIEPGSAVVFNALQINFLPNFEVRSQGLFQVFTAGCQ